MHSGQSAHDWLTASLSRIIGTTSLTETDKTLRWSKLSSRSSSGNYHNYIISHENTTQQWETTKVSQSVSQSIVGWPAGQSEGVVGGLAVMNETRNTEDRRRRRRKWMRRRRRRRRALMLSSNWNWVEEGRMKKKLLREVMWQSKRNRQRSTRKEKGRQQQRRSWKGLEEWAR